MTKDIPLVSVIVSTYKSQWDKIRKTLYSILQQDNTIFEIIICDDGSPDNYFERIEDYFSKSCFSNYLLLKHNQNQGTVKNYLDGLKHAKGKYVKAISPGDFLYDKNTLQLFVQYAELHPADAYFGKAIYYNIIDNNIHIFDDVHNPRDLSPWINKDKRKIRYNYIRKSDYIVGASFFVKKDTQLNYLLRIEDKIKYAEDYSFVMMIAEGRNIEFINKPVIFYEYGTGISTNGQSIWKQYLLQDDLNALQLIWPSLSLAEKLEKKQNKRMDEKIMRYILTPKLIFLRFGIKNTPPKIKFPYTDNDYSNLIKILNS